MCGSGGPRAITLSSSPPSARREASILQEVAASVPGLEPPRPPRPPQPRASLVCHPNRAAGDDFQQPPRLEESWYGRQLLRRGILGVAPGLSHISLSMTQNRFTHAGSRRGSELSRLLLLPPMHATDVGGTVPPAGDDEGMLVRATPIATVLSPASRTGKFWRDNLLSQLPHPVTRAPPNSSTTCLALKSAKMA